MKKIELPIQEVLDLYFNKKMVSKDIGKKFGVAIGTVLRIIHEHAPGKVRQTLNLPVDDIIALHRAGKKSREIGKIYGCGHTPIQRIIRKHIPDEVRQNCIIPCAISTDKVLTLYDSGLTSTEVSNEVGCCATTVINRLHKYAPEKVRSGSDYKKWISSGEIDVLNFIKGQVKDIEVLVNTRKIISPMELDIYIPSLKLAIEFNGVYWHSDEHKAPDYHQKKYIECNKQGIRLIQISERDWIHSQILVQSMLKSALGISNYRFYARNCIVKKIEPSVSGEFLRVNHIQGNCRATHHFGLFSDNGDLISVMTLGKTRFGKPKDGELEIIRSATKIDTSVIGGFSKMIHAVEKSKICNSLLSYCNLDYFDGRSYEKANFTNEGITIPGYSYINTKNGQIQSRQSLQKWKLLEQNTQLNPKKTGDQLAKELGFHKVFNTGNLVFKKLLNTF